MKSRVKIRKSEARIAAMAAPLADKLHVNIKRLALVKEAGNLILRVILEKTGGVDLNDCEKFSRELSRLLDQADLIQENYFLEVTSPGIEEGEE